MNFQGCSKSTLLASWDLYFQTVVTTALQISQSVTLTFRLLPNADVKAAAVAKPPGPPPTTATSTSVAQDFAVILTVALRSDRLQACLR